MILAMFVVAGLIVLVWSRLQRPGESAGRGQRPLAVPVEVAKIEQGLIELHRTFSGSLESTAKFVVAPKVSGRVEDLAVDLADTVERGQVVAQLDNDEYIQNVAQAKADLVVARANRSEAKSALEIAHRKLKRIQTLKERGVASDSQLDAAKAEQLSAQAKLEVAKAQATKAQASLESARIRLGYTSVSADWTEGDDNRLVAERFVDEGDTVSAGSPLMSIVELDPITGVIFVTEKDYARLRIGQSVKLITDAFDNEFFEGRVSRIAPIFQESTRQARVEFIVDNPDHRLKPGMFIRATIVLERVARAVIIPDTALTKRNDKTGLFLVDQERKKVSWREVRLGIRQGNKVQVLGPGLSGWVVTLGQQMLDDGSIITIPEKQRPSTFRSKESKT